MTHRQRATKKEITFVVVTKIESITFKIKERCEVLLIENRFFLRLISRCNIRNSKLKLKEKIYFSYS